MSGPKLRGRRWSPLKVREALEAFALSGNCKASAKLVGVPCSTVDRWVHNHVEEIAAIKRRNAEIQERVTSESIEEMFTRHAEAGQQMSRAGLAQLGMLDPEDASAFGAARLVTAGIDVERLARGEVTDRQGLNIWQEIKAEIDKEQAGNGEE